MFTFRRQNCLARYFWDTAASDTIVHFIPNHYSIPFVGMPRCERRGWRVQCAHCLQQLHCDSHPFICTRKRSKGQLLSITSHFYDLCALEMSERKKAARFTVRALR